MSQHTFMVTGLHCQSCVRVGTAAELTVEQGPGRARRRG